MADLPVGIRPGKAAGTWEVRVTLPKAPGERRARELSRTVTGGIRQAKAERAKMLAERSRHVASPGTVADLLAQWLTLVEPGKSPATMRGYRDKAKYVLADPVGAMQLRRLDTRAVDRFYADLQAGSLHGRRLSPKTVRAVHTVLNQTLEQAVAWGMLAANPAARATLPKLTETELRPPAVADYRRLLDRATEKDEARGAFLWLAGSTGARRGELCGLRWSDVDRTTLTVTFARSVVHGDGRLVVKGTKTDRARRIAITSVDLDRLDAHLVAMQARAALLSSRLAADAYVFSDAPDCSTPWRPNTLTEWFIRLRDEVGVDCRLHDLRHMHVTMLLAAGGDVRTVAGRVGHAQATMTLNRYAHFVEQADRAAAEIARQLLASD